MSKSPVLERLVFEDNRLVPALVGEHNAHLSHIEDILNVSISLRGNEISIAGPEAKRDQARQVLEALWSKLLQGQIVDFNTVDAALRFLDNRTRQSQAAEKGLKEFKDHDIQIQTRKKIIQPRTPMQSAYMEAMQKKQLVFGIGPAGTGKTYLAIAHAVSLMERGMVERIILSRPAVEAGERLGFLPGEMKEKMDPYMRPLYDALHDTMQGDKLVKMMATEEIEIAPLAFMRGRTLNNACVILDEAQNATTNQMMMFLTRLGENSFMVVTGDPSQTDLPRGTMSGLDEAHAALANAPDIGFIQFSRRDVVRSRIVTQVIEYYEQYHSGNKQD